MSVIKNPPERADHFYACAGGHPGMQYAKIQAGMGGCGEITRACSHAPGGHDCKAPIALGGRRRLQLVQDKSLVLRCFFLVQRYRRTLLKAYALGDFSTPALVASADAQSVAAAQFLEFYIPEFWSAAIWRSRRCSLRRSRPYAIDVRSRL
ncbi:hypothetical protein AB7M16_006614 [Bradyrhizobium sp. USDA 372]